MANMSVTASGQGTNPAKIMFYLGLLFVVIGAAIGICGIIGMVALGEAGMLIFSIFFVAMFCGIGGFFAKVGHDNMHAPDAILEEGAAYLGKVFAHEPDNQLIMNGQPCITLVVRYLMMGEIHEARVNTGEVNAALFPIGSTVSIKVLDGTAALVPGSVDDMHIERENDLMNPDIDPLGIRSSIGVSCPNCGANITVPLGMSRFCPYCNTKVSVDAAGRMLG